MNGELKADMPTIEDLLLVNLPEGVTLLPEDWEGKTERAWMRLTLSKQAIKNEKFPLRAFIKSKFNNSLTALRKRKNFEQLSLLRRMTLSIDTVSDKHVIIFHIYIEYSIWYGKRNGTTDNGGVSALAAGYAGGAELTEQREQSQTTFELCRVATEVGESQGRHDDDQAGRLADDQAGLSYPDKRDCGVSQRAKENDHGFHEFNELIL